MTSKNMCFTRVFASVKTAFAFYLVWRQRTCVSHTSLHRLRQLSCFPWYGATIHAFHTHVCIGLDDFCVFRRIALQCMRFTRMPASMKTAFVFSLVWRYNACVSHASMHRLIRVLRLLRVALQCMHFTRVSASVKTAFAFLLVWFQNACVSHARLRFALVLRHYACVSHACLYRLRRLLHFPWSGVTMHAFHSLVCIYYDGFCVFLCIWSQ